MLTNEQKAKINQPINDAFFKKNQYDKFGDGTYVPVEMYIRAMNEIFGPINWSYRVSGETEKEDYIQVKVVLSVNGVDVREEYGSAKKDKKDNSSASNAALSYALKKCIARLGIFPNLEEKWDIPLFAPMPVSPEEAKRCIDELKGAYKLTTKDDFVKFAQIWNPAITAYNQLNPNIVKELYDYVKANEAKFESFAVSA